MPLTDTQVLGIMFNKVFFKGSLKPKDNPETKANARKLEDLINYVRKKGVDNKIGSVSWFLAQISKDDLPIFKAAQDHLENARKNINNDKSIAKMVNNIELFWKSIKNYEGTDEGLKELAKNTVVDGILKEWIANVEGKSLSDFSVKSKENIEDTLTKWYFNHIKNLYMPEGGALPTSLDKIKDIWTGLSEKNADDFRDEFTVQKKKTLASIQDIKYRTEFWWESGKLGVAYICCFARWPIKRIQEGKVDSFKNDMDKAKTLITRWSKQSGVKAPTGLTDFFDNSKKFAKEIVGSQETIRKSTT